MSFRLSTNIKELPMCLEAIQTSTLNQRAYNHGGRDFNVIGKFRKFFSSSEESIQLRTILDGNHLHSKRLNELLNKTESERSEKVKQIKKKILRKCKYRIVYFKWYFNWTIFKLEFSPHPTMRTKHNFIIRFFISAENFFHKTGELTSCHRLLF